MKDDELEYDPSMMALIVVIYIGWVAVIGSLVWWLVK